VEKTTSSLTLIAMAQRAGIIVRELRPDRNKQSRAEAAATLCANGRVFFPRDAAWLEPFESELLGFPTAAHDDCVDVLAYAANEVARGAVRGRRPPAPDPSTPDEWAAEHARRQRRRPFHPVLGRI
jgi:phage terminase large subunit-like protein